jgi:glycosyltransferase involved in cell wall biosynthesis
MSAPLRVVLLDSIPSWGGGEKWCVEAAGELKKRSHHVAIACTENSALAARAAAAGTEVWPMRFGGLRSIATAREFAKRLREERIELVIANIGRDLRIAAFACSRSQARLLQRRGIARKLKRDPLHRFIYRKCVRRVIANCAAIRDEMLGAGDVIGPERFVVIENGVEVGGPGNGARWRADHGIAPRVPLAIVVGRLAPMKGHEHLLRAWKRVLAREPAAQLAILGDGESSASLSALSAQLDLERSVHFTGFVRDLADPYAAADVFVLPSVRDEGCNNALLEAMARGLPAVVTRCGGLPESVVEGETGRVVPIADPVALADAVLELFADPERRARFGEAGKARALEHYSVARVTDELERVLSEVRDGP